MRGDVEVQLEGGVKEKEVGRTREERDDISEGFMSRHTAAEA